MSLTFILDLKSGVKTFIGCKLQIICMLVKAFSMVSSSLLQLFDYLDFCESDSPPCFLTEENIILYWLVCISFGLVKLIVNGSPDQLLNL